MDCRVAYQTLRTVLLGTQRTMPSVGPDECIPVLFGRLISRSDASSEKWISTIAPFGCAMDVWTLSYEKQISTYDESSGTVP